MSWLLLRAKWIPHFSPPELSVVHTRQRLALLMRLSRIWALALTALSETMCWKPRFSGRWAVICPLQPPQGPTAVQRSTTTVWQASWWWVAMLWGSAAAECRWRQGFNLKFKTAFFPLYHRGNEEQLTTRIHYGEDRKGQTYYPNLLEPFSEWRNDTIEEIHHVKVFHSMFK